MPNFLAHQKEIGSQIWIELPIEARVQQILQDYQPQQYKAQYIASFSRIKSRIHVPIAAEIDRCLNADQFAEAVRLMLEYYYDPKYDYTSQQYEDISKVTFTVNNLDEAEAAVIKYLNGLN
ncbi:tRNA 2-selenouridine synthase [compost metagenome]